MLPLFVYGTLMRDEAAHFRIAPDIRSIESAWTRGQLVHFTAGYPALIPRLDRRVYGELVYLNRSAVLQELDIYEGFDTENPMESLFIRRIRAVTTGRGQKLEAWCYLMPKAPLAEHPEVGEALDLPEGRWRGNMYSVHTYPRA